MREFSALFIILAIPFIVYAFFILIPKKIFPNFNSVFRYLLGLIIYLVAGIFLLIIQWNFYSDFRSTEDVLGGFLYVLFWPFFGSAKLFGWYN